MATSPAPVSLDEYMHTEYEPDCEYIDGVLEDRNVGKRKHSRTQALLTGWLLARENQHGYRILTEQRVQLSRSRIRIPDVCLVPKGDRDEVTQHPPPLWIEILSPDDRWSRVQQKLKDILAFGVPIIWIIDPYSSDAWIATAKEGAAPVEDGVLRCSNPNLEMPLAEILPQD